MSSLQIAVNPMVPPAVLQMDFINLDSSFQFDAVESCDIQRKPARRVMLHASTNKPLDEQPVPASPETQAEIDDWLTVHTNKLVKSTAKPIDVGPTETLRFERKHGREHFERRLKKGLKILVKTPVRSRQRRVLDWMIGHLLTWHEVQITPSSFRWTCTLNEVDPNQLREQVLDLCKRRGIVPQYARMHLAACRWLEWLPRPDCPRQEKLQRLRRLFTPLLIQEELFVAPLLPGPERDRVVRQFKETCTEYGADQDLTRRLLWYHCMRWQIAPFDAHERLAVAN